MSTDRRRLLYRAAPSVSTETEPESVFYDNPAFENGIYEKPKVHGKHSNHVSWDIDEYGGQGQGHHGKSKSREVSREDPGTLVPRPLRFSSGYSSKNSFSYDTADELNGDYDESRDTIDDIRDKKSNTYNPRERYDSHKTFPRGNADRSNQYYPRENPDELYSKYNDTGRYQDKNSNIVFDSKGRNPQTFKREPSWKKQYRKGGAFYITVDSDDSSGYPSSSTFRQDGSVTAGSVAGERRRSFSLSPQSSDDRARAPYQTPSPRLSRSPVGDRLTVEAAVHWPNSSLAGRKHNDVKDVNGSESPYTSRRYDERDNHYNPRDDYDGRSPSISPYTSRKNQNTSSQYPIRTAAERVTPDSRKAHIGSSPFAPREKHDSGSSSSSRNDQSRDSYRSSATPGKRGRSPISSTSTGSTYLDSASTSLSITEAFALQAKGYLMSRKLNDSISSSGEYSGGGARPKEQNQPLLLMPPGTGSGVGKAIRRTESESSDDTTNHLWVVHEEMEDLPLGSIPSSRNLSNTHETIRPHQKLSQTESGGSLASLYKQHRKLSETTSGGSQTSLKRDSLIPMRERKNSSIFQDLNLTFREVSESELYTDSDFEDGPLPVENGGVGNGSAVMMRDGLAPESRRARGRGTESPLPITSEDTEDMIVMIMSNRSPCVARFISLCGVFQMLCGFIVMMSGASGYLNNMSLLSSGVTFDFPIGFYIGLSFTFSGGWGIKSSHTKRKCVNVMAASTSAFSLMAALFILVLIAYPGALKFSCSDEEKGLYIFHLVCFTTEIIFSGIQCVMCAKSLVDSQRSAKHLRNRESSRQDNA